MRSTEADAAPAQHGSQARGFAAAALVVLCWSGFNIVSRMGGRSALTPFDIAALRFGVSGALLAPVLIRRGLRFTPAQALALATFGGIGYALCVYGGFGLAPASHAAVLVNGGIPFATLIIGSIAVGYRPSRMTTLSLLLAAPGIALIGMESFAAAPGRGPRQWLGDLLFLAGAACYASFGLLLRKWRAAPVDAAATVSTVSMLAYLPVYILFLPKALGSVPAHFIALQCMYQGVIAASVAVLLYAYANQVIGAMKASLMLALVPGVTAVAAVPLLGEPLTLATLAGVLLVTAGAVTGTRSRAGAAA